MASCKPFIADRVNPGPQEDYSLAGDPDRGKVGYISGAGQRVVAAPDHLLELIKQHASRMRANMEQLAPPSNSFTSDISTVLSDAARMSPEGGHVTTTVLLGGVTMTTPSSVTRTASDGSQHQADHWDQCSAEYNKDTMMPAVLLGDNNDTSPLPPRGRDAYQRHVDRMKALKATGKPQITPPPVESPRSRSQVRAGRSPSPCGIVGGAARRSPVVSLSASGRPLSAPQSR